RLHLESGGSSEDARVISDAVRISYPNIGALEQFAPTSPVLLVNVSPSPQGGFRLKIYYNIRLGNPAGHEEAVTRLLERIGLAGGPVKTIYEHLYLEGVHMPGVGIDIDGGGRLGARI